MAFTTRRTHVSQSKQNRHFIYLYHPGNNGNAFLNPYISYEFIRTDIKLQTYTWLAKPVPGLGVGEVVTILALADLIKLETEESSTKHGFHKPGLSKSLCLRLQGTESNFCRTKIRHVL